jgi:hypothetical protein
MGLNKSEPMTYLNVANGKLVRQHREATSETVQRTNKSGKVVHEEFFKDLTGTITRIETKENEYGKQWQIVFQDGTHKYMVQMPYSGRYSSSFLKTLPNVTQGQPVKFKPWEMTDKHDSSKKITGVTLYQDDGNGFVKIPSAFTKEDQNGLPEMKKVKIKGKETWDDFEMMTFLENMAKEWIASAPKVKEPGEKLPFDEAPF